MDLRVKENKKIFPTVRQTYSQHDAMLDVEENLFLFSVVPDKSMQCVGMRNPTQQTWVCWQRDNCVTLNSENSNHRTHILLQSHYLVVKRDGYDVFFTDHVSINTNPMQKWARTGSPYSGFLVVFVAASSLQWAQWLIKQRHTDSIH